MVTAGQKGSKCTFLCARENLGILQIFQISLVSLYLQLNVAILGADEI